jgi:hypothetical protein
VFVLVQGVASVDLTPSRDRLEAFLPQGERFIGSVKRGPGWDWLLHEYYYERVFVDVTVERLVWDNLATARRHKTESGGPGHRRATGTAAAHPDSIIYPSGEPFEDPAPNLTV